MCASVKVVKVKFPMKNIFNSKQPIVGKIAPGTYEVQFCGNPYPGSNNWEEWTNGDNDSIGVAYNGNGEKNGKFAVRFKIVSKGSYENAIVTTTFQAFEFLNGNHPDTFVSDLMAQKGLHVAPGVDMGKMLHDETFTLYYGANYWIDKITHKPMHNYKWVADKDKLTSNEPTIPQRKTADEI